jgi:pantetheine-phosphate adenylyltransferase
MVDFYRKMGATAVVRGLRSESDFRYEAEIAAANRILLPDFESILLPCRSDLAFTSAKIVREVATYGGDIRGMVPSSIAEEVSRRLLRKNRPENAPLLSEREG